MSFTTAVRTCFQKYANFEGRAKRSEFWWWMLFQTLVTGLAAIIGLGFLIAASAGNPGQANGPLLVIGVTFVVLAILLALALLVPSYAVGCRRLHDRGQSGWLQLLVLVPCGSIVLIVFWALGGASGKNIYGEASP